jgi:hypothetical protein
MNINETFPSKHLKASDLGGTQPIVTIERVEYEPVGQEREMKAVVYFQGKAKGVVLNKTNAAAIVALAGSEETDDWPGVQVRLFASTTEYQGKPVACIRIKAVGTLAKPKPRPQAVPVPVVSEADDSGFPGDDDPISF